ncbi:MAG: hypothetical protein WC306_03535 [Candidatus Paceibacterota bacterium]|jgi:hypothetical protein
MKQITITQLKQMIKEELQKQLVKEGKFTEQRLIALFDKYKVQDAELFANGKHYNFGGDDIQDDVVFGTEHHGGEKEIPIKDIEFITINGKRIS